MAEVLSTDFSDTEAETDFETAKNRAYTQISTLGSNCQHY